MVEKNKSARIQEKSSAAPLPPFQTALLGNFLFGDPDGKHDEVLVHSAMQLRGTREFLAGNKAIVLGERGSGKSAMFKLIAEGTFKFGEPSDKLKPLVVAIDDDMQYMAVANLVEERFEDRATSATGKYQFLWEIFILATVLRSLLEIYPDDLEIKTLHSDFAELFGAASEKTEGLASFLGRFKYSVGTKFDQSGAVSPTLSVEPAKASLERRQVTDHEVAQLRDRVRKVIRNKKRVVYILVDRVDDFVTGQAYEEQKKNVQALVEIVQNFRYPELKLKLFLRADIFGKLSFERGIDKVAHQVVRLEWTTDDIAEFVARRLLYNYLRLSVRLPHLGISMAMLDVDPATREQFFNLFRSSPKSVTQGLSVLWQMAVVGCKVKWDRFRKQDYSARKTNSVDEVFNRLITLIFPTKVTHLSVHCKREEMAFRQFLATHFVLGGCGPNPRLVLLFLQSVVEEATAYYSRNPDKKIVAPNAMGEYELILREHVLAGYWRTQQIARQTLAGLNAQWTKQIQSLFALLKRPVQCEGLDWKNLKQVTKWDRTEDEFHQFVAFFAHVGLLEDERKGSGQQVTDRTYCLPIVVRTCKDNA